VAAGECAEAAETPEQGDSDGDEPNERTQHAARQLDELVKRA